MLTRESFPGLCEGGQRHIGLECWKCVHILLKTYPDRLLERHLVHMLFCLECEVVLLVQIEELLPVAARKIIPLADPHAETIIFGIAQCIHE